MTVYLPVGAGTPQPRGAPLQVLIVDDQAPFRIAARSLFRLLPGWDVFGEATTGEEAVAVFSSARPPGERPDLVLMDINLPGINGIEATRQITAAAPGTVVLLVSTYAEADLPADARTCGAAAYIRKDDLTPRLLRELLT